MDFFVCVGKTNVLMLTLRFRINVQQNSYVFLEFFLPTRDFHVMNEKEVPTYTIIRAYTIIRDFRVLL